MKKKLAVLACLVLAMTALLCTTVTAEAQKQPMRVGYAKVDINPYVYHYVDENREGEVPVEVFKDENGREYYTNWNRDADGNTEYELMPLPLRGFREPMERLTLTYKMDDNGDRIVNEEDGIWGTCIVMTAEDGSTLVTISLDLIGVDEGSRLDGIRQSIQEATGIPEDRIMVQGTHTHFAPDFSKITTALSTDETTYIRYDDGKYFTGAEIYNCLVKYRDDMTRIITDAVVRAVADQEVAVMEKGGIDTSEAENCPDGYRMNVVRHYQMTRQKILKDWNGNYVKDSNGNYVVDPFGVKVEYIAGDNFNGGGDPPGTKYGTYVVTKAQSVAESDDMLYALRFTFPDADKDPIVLINWRAHPCNNRSVSADKDILGWPNDSSYYQVSGDYVNAFRKELENAGVRVSFHQGAGGNVNTGDASLANKWTEQYGTDKGNIYGRRLGKIALELVGESGTGLNEIDGGPIRVSHVVYHNSGNTNSPAILAAAQLFEEYYEGPIPLEGEGYQVVDANGSGYGETGERVIDTYTGAYVTIASRYHANAVLSRAKVAGKAAYGRVELGAAMIGDSVAFVNAPGELYDRYDDEGTLTDSETTGWKSLVDTETYGIPFVLGYCNGTRGYFPNRAAYSYNYANKDSAGNLSNDAVGSYESQTSRLAPGGGEQMISLMHKLIDHMMDENTGLPAKCEHCGVEVVWSPWNQANAACVDAVSSGHYYLTEDVSGYVKKIEADREVCIYLNGHTITGDTRAFTLASGGKLSIMGEGTVVGTNVIQGGTICVYGDAECNLYGGTVLYTSESDEALKLGGTVYVLENGVFNQYGGTITGGKTNGNGGNIYTVGNYNMYGGSITNGTAIGKVSGGNVYVSAKGSFTMHGGTISGGRAEFQDAGTPCGGNIYADGKFTMNGGTVENGYAYWAGGNIYVLKEAEFNGGTVTAGTAGTVSDCIHTNGTVRLSGDPKIDQLRFGKQVALTVAGEFTGNVVVAYATVPALGAEVGVAENALFTSDCLIFQKVGYKYVFKAVDGKLVIAQRGNAAKLSTGETFESLALAVKAAQDTDATVILLENVAEKLTATGTVRVDLAGFNITGGASTTGNGAILLSDSKTDDFTVADGTYGKLSGTVTGNVNAADGYLLITESGGVSAHRTVMELTHMNLRPNVLGLYFTGDFKADEVVQASVKSFGIALNAYEAPNATNMHTTSLYTSLTDWEEGSQSVLLSGIMKAENDMQTNWDNGSTRVYANTYIETEEGYVFGAAYAVSLEEMTELVSKQWGCLGDFQQGSLLDMYGTWWDVMDYWDIPEIKSAF